MDAYNGKVLASAPMQFQSEVEWVRSRSAKKDDAEGSNVKKMNYVCSVGTVVQFLDEFEREAMRKFPHHRFTVKRQKGADLDWSRVRWPGWCALTPTASCEPVLF